MEMILRYKGYWIRTNKKEWEKLTTEEKCKTVKEYFQEESRYIKESFKDFWIGYVNVRTQNIFCDDHFEIYHLVIECGRFRHGQLFSEIDKETAEKLVKDWDQSYKKRYYLKVNLGCGAYQEYTFSRKQKEILIKQLKEILKRKWYKEE